MPREPKMLKCFNCGDDVWWGIPYAGELDCCGKSECQRELRDAMRQREADAREAAEEDGYSRYGGGW